LLPSIYLASGSWEVPKSRAVTKVESALDALQCQDERQAASEALIYELYCRTWRHQLLPFLVANTSPGRITYGLRAIYVKSTMSSYSESSSYGARRSFDIPHEGHLHRTSSSTTIHDSPSRKYGGVIGQLATYGTLNGPRVKHALDSDLDLAG
jgi:hypothetical protein